MTILDFLFMQRAITLANRGTKVLPNPKVGAVLVYNGKIIGEGYHHGPGLPHAEVNAINQAIEDHPDLIAKSTLYVTLEPCNHHGRTPPCTNAILKYRIPRVVVGCLDPNPHVEGNGLKRLKEAGVECLTGVHKKKCQDLIADFLIVNQKDRPYILLKYALSRDEYFAPDQGQQWLSSFPAKVAVHKWRSEYSGILVGTDTALIDDPRLTTRHFPGEDPVRFVLDRKGRLLPHLQIFNDTNETYVLTCREDYPIASAKCIYIPTNQWNISNILNKIRSQNVYKLMVEGGAQLIDSFLEQGLWDEARVFHCSTDLGTGKKLKYKPKGRVFSSPVGNDQLSPYYNTP